MTRWRLVLRPVRAATAIAITVALVAQFDRSIDLPEFGAVDFFSYFTVLSNVAAVVVLGMAAARPILLRLHTFTIVRGAMTLYMAVTGLVYAVLLAPASANVGLTLGWVDLVVHRIAPVVVVADWVLDPPQTRPRLTSVLKWLWFPLLYLVYSLVRGPRADWYPYPFLDPDEAGSYPVVAVTCAGILVVFLVVTVVLWWRAGRGGWRERAKLAR